MNFLLANSFFESYGILIVLAVSLGVLMIVSYNRKKTEMFNRNSLVSALKVGINVKTYGGLYGKIVKIEETTDGKIVTLETGHGKQVSYITIHIEAIYGEDTKQAVVLDAQGNPIIGKVSSEEIDLDKLMEERIKLSESKKETETPAVVEGEKSVKTTTAKPKSSTTTKKSTGTKAKPTTSKAKSTDTKAKSTK